MTKKDISNIAEKLAQTITPFGGMYYNIENMDESGASYVYDRACDLGFSPNEDDCYKIMGKMQAIFNTW